MPPGITYGQATSRHILFTVYITTNIHFGSSAKNALTVEREQGEEEEEARGSNEKPDRTFHSLKASKSINRRIL